MILSSVHTTSIAMLRPCELQIRLHYDFEGACNVLRSVSAEVSGRCVSLPICRTSSSLRHTASLRPLPQAIVGLFWTEVTESQTAVQCTGWIGAAQRDQLCYPVSHMCHDWALLQLSSMCLKCGRVLKLSLRHEKRAMHWQAAQHRMFCREGGLSRLKY